MVALRLAIVLLLSVAVDLSAPLVPESMEGLNEIQPVARVPHGQHAVRSFRDVSVAPVDGQTVPAVQPTQRTSGQPPVRAMASGRVRKTPPSTPDSASAPEDH